MARVRYNLGLDEPRWRCLAARCGLYFPRTVLGKALQAARGVRDGSCPGRWSAIGCRGAGFRSVFREARGHSVTSDPSRIFLGLDCSALAFMPLSLAPVEELVRHDGVSAATRKGRRGGVPRHIGDTCAPLALSRVRRSPTRSRLRYGAVQPAAPQAVPGTSSTLRLELRSRGARNAGFAGSPVG